MRCPSLRSYRSPTFPPRCAPVRHFFNQVGQHQGRKVGEGASTGDPPISSLATPLSLPQSHRTTPCPFLVLKVVAWSGSVTLGEGLGHRKGPKNPGDTSPTQGFGCRAVVARAKARALGGDAFQIPPMTS